MLETLDCWWVTTSIWFTTSSPGHSSQSSSLSSLFNSTVVISFPLSTTATSSTVNFLTFYLMYLSTISALRLSSVLRSRNLLDCLSLLCLALECVRNLLDCLSLLCLALECVRNLGIVYHFFAWPLNMSHRFPQMSSHTILSKYPSFLWALVHHNKPNKQLSF